MSASAEGRGKTQKGPKLTALVIYAVRCEWIVVSGGRDSGENVGEIGQWVLLRQEA